MIPRAFCLVNAFSLQFAMLCIAWRNSLKLSHHYKIQSKKGDDSMDDLSFEIGKNIRKYRKLKGLTIERLAEVLETETNYLGQCERGERRFSLDKLIDLIEYFGITANDIIPVQNREEKKNREKNIYLQEINEILESCSDNQLAVVLNILKESVPFLKE